MHLKHSLNMALLGGALLALGHPGHHEPVDGPDGQLYKRSLSTGLQKCSTSLAKTNLHARVQARHEAMLELHRRHLHIRDTEKVLNTSHEATYPVSPSMPESAIFNAPEKVCLLGPSPEGETGPYWLPGEHIRADIRENEPGVPVILSQQYIDVETCQPVPDLYTEIWGCNATGVYSGLVADGNGNAADKANHNRTFLRGIQKTDSDGVVTFNTLFPGHYDSRATHYHNVAHVGARPLPNNTIAGGSVAHVGQIFWDQELIQAVEATYPYNTNDIPITPNAEDRVVGVETANSEADPMLNYALLGDSLEDGLFAWITVAVNLSAVHYPYWTNVYTEDGGVAVEGTSDGSPREIDGGLPQTSSLAN
ncbi:Intradiol ring-cleavage dioxygenase [Aspergillus californicus]